MLRRLVGLLPRRSEFRSLLIHVRSVLDRVAVGHVFLLSHRFPPVSIIPPGLHTHLHLHAALTETQTGDEWEPLKINVVSEIGEHGIEKYFDVIFDGLRKTLLCTIVQFLKTYTLLCVKLPVVTVLKTCL